MQYKILSNKSDIMERSKRKNNLIITPINNPYQLNVNDTLGIIYNRYIKDIDSLIIKDKLIYYKILQSFIFKNKTVNILAFVDIKMNLHINDILIDENKNTYIVKSFELFRLNCTDFPEWYCKIIPVLLEGNPDNIGEYLALYKSKYND